MCDGGGGPLGTADHTGSLDGLRQRYLMAEHERGEAIRGY